MVRWGVLGCGGIARRRTIPEGILPARNSELVALVDSNIEIAEEMGRELGAEWYESEDQLVCNETIDAVYIATPVHLHAAQAIKALQSGKHVLVEKPPAMTISECEVMIEEARKHKVKLGVGFMMRFHGLHQKLRKMVAEGELGTPVLARAQLSCWYPPIEGAWRQKPELGGGGSLIDMGNHLLDLLEYIFQSPVAEVSCYTGNLVQAYQSEDSALTMVRFKNGALGMVDAFFSIPDNSSKNALEIYGSKGSVLAQGTIGQSSGGTARAYIEREGKGYEAQQARPAGEGEELDFPTPNLYQSEIEEFAAAILENREPSVSGSGGLWSQKLLLAAYESAKSGRSIGLST